MTIAILALMVAIVIGILIVLREDAKQRRINRQVLTALGEHREITTGPTTIRRQIYRHKLLQSVIGYQPNGPHWPMGYTVLIAGVIAVGAVFLAKMVLALPLAIVSGVIVCVLVIRGLLGWQKSRYADKLLRQMPDCIELVVSAVKAGLPVGEAFQTAAQEMPAPTKEQFVWVTQDMSLGRTPEEAVRSIFDRTQVTEYAMLSVTLAVQSKAGGRLAETLQTLGDTVRERVALAGRARALAGEAKLSARVLASIPFAAGGLLYFERPASMEVLFYDPRGRVLFAIGLSSLIMGILTMRHMIKKGTTV